MQPLSRVHWEQTPPTLLPLESSSGKHWQIPLGNPGSLYQGRPRVKVEHKSQHSKELSPLRGPTQIQRARASNTQQGGLSRYRYFIYKYLD